MKEFLTTLGVGLLFAGSAIAPAFAPEQDGAPVAPSGYAVHQNYTETQIIVIPHEDDEFEAWSQIEFNRDTYKLFVVLGNGEQTAFCSGHPGGFQPELGELLPPSGPPGAQFSQACADARLSSMVQFFATMSMTDRTIPGDLIGQPQTGQFPADVPIVRDDLTYSYTDTSARVWLDAKGRGALVAWNIGEADESPEEIDWAIRTTIANFVPADKPLTEIVGAYANEANPDCFIYPHADHLAVHTALKTYDYGVPVKVASCSTDAGVTLTNQQVSDKSMSAAFGLGPNGERLGAHNALYGWLHMESYPLDWYGQAQIFHGNQAFWTSE